MMDNDLVIDILLAFGVVVAAPIVCCCLVAFCLSQMEERNRRKRNAVIQLADAIIPEIPYEETHGDSTNSSRITRQVNYHQSLSVSFPPEIILIPTQHVINPECDSPPRSYSLSSQLTAHKLTT